MSNTGGAIFWQQGVYFAAQPQVVHFWGLLTSFGIIPSLLCTAREFSTLFTNKFLFATFNFATLPFQSRSTCTPYISSVTFNTLNQTKTISAALWCYVLLGKPQSLVQIISLVMLLFSALLIEGSILDTSTLSAAQGLSQERLVYGVVPVLLASLLSGLAGAISQKFLQGSGARNSYLFSMEVSAKQRIAVLSKIFY